MAKFRKKENQKDMQEYINDLQQYFTNGDKHTLNLLQQGKISKDDFMDKALNYLTLKGVDYINAKNAVEAFENYTFGYNILNELIDDKTISDIRIVNENNIRIKRLGKREGTNLKFDSKDNYIRFVNFIATKNKVNLSDLNASQIFTDKTTSPDFILRFDIATGFINSTEAPYVHIRKIPKVKIDIDTLVKDNMLDEKTRDYLINKAVNGSGILFTGKGSSGKTTIMNALLEKIPHDKSGLIIQESEELFSNTHPELMFQHIVANRGEGKIKYTLKDLAKSGLLMDLDYFVIGEIKGDEARYFLNAAYTGHKCWASVHGMNSQEALDKLADYIKDVTDYSKSEVMKMLRYVNTIVYMEDYKVKEISEVVGWDSEKKELIYKKILG